MRRFSVVTKAFVKLSNSKTQSAINKKGTGICIMSFKSYVLVQEIPNASAQVIASIPKTKTVSGFVLEEVQCRVWHFLSFSHIQQKNHKLRGGRSSL